MTDLAGSAGVTADTTFAGAGPEIGPLLRAVDWASNPLGPVESWPQSLRTALSIILRSRFPMFVFWGPELVQIYNDAYVPIPGGKHPRSLGSPAKRTWAEIWDVLGPLVESVMERGEATWSEDQLLLMDRRGFTEETYFTFSYSPVQDESGGIGGVFCACTETTGRVLADRRLRTVRDLGERTSGARTLEAAASGAVAAFSEHRDDLPSVAMYLVDEDQGSARLAGCVGFEPGSEAVPAAIELDDDASPWPVAAVLTTGQIEHVDDLVGRVDLPTEPWGIPPREAVVVPVTDPTSGDPTGVLVATVSPRRPFDADFRDFVLLVSDSLAKAFADARAREREQERLDALAELNRAKSEFFSNVSHEFRTPLTLMLGPLDAAVTAGSGLAPTAAAQVQRNATRLLKLVNTLLDFSRIEAGRMRATFRPTDLARFTAELASVFQSAAARLGLDYDVSCDPLPEPVHVDRDLWEKIVLNLLSNAVKFTPRGGISIRLSAAGDAARLEVTDTGVGIADEDIPFLFQRFYRVEGSQGRSFEGSGIGLALVHDLVELHGGSVEVTSEPGTGSTFTVLLPFGTAHLPEERVAADAEWHSSGVAREAYVAEATGWVTSDELDADLVPAPRAAEPHATVLVVDDNADMRRYLQEILGPFWAVRTAPDGEAALAEIRSAPPDLVLTDVMMPRRDGFSLLAAIRDDDETRDIPVIMLSARAGEEASGAGLDAGADDYVVKPFSADQLVARVRANLEMARLRTSVAAARGRADLIAGVSHDMQTPLAVILAALEELGSGSLAPNEADDLIAAATRRAEYLRLLVQQFLDHARIEEGVDPEVRTSTVDLAAALTEAVDLVAGDGRVTVAAAPPVGVVADPDRVRQMLLNMLENALRYTTGAVTVRIEEGDGRATVAVADEGPGLDDHELPRVFDRFFRGSTADGTTGSGIGLYVSRLLAELQGGRLDAISDPEGGSTFRLTLPMTT